MNHLACELLAPAGNFDMLRAAIDGGADAAYLGLQSFNARRNAKNFDFDSFEEACRYAHLRGARLYVAMNTIVFEEELEEAVKVAARAYDIGADAFIIQDIGLAHAIRANVEGARLHASTQMSIHSVEGLRMAPALGFSRVTLAREMSLGEIDHVCKEAERIGIEVETFAHGALCISYSGQCLMSSMIGCRSANRGLCAQPCRLEYELVDTRDPERPVKAQGDHLLSPKDLCSIDDIDALVEMGVSSLKIEGRMKSPEYAYTVVSVYREQLDNALRASCAGEPCAQPDASARDKLESVFSRGFSSSYLEGNRGNSMMSYQRPNNRGQFVGRVKSASDDTIEVALEQQLKSGDICEIWTRRGNIILNIEEDTTPSKRSFSFALDDAKSRNSQNRTGAFRPSKGDRVFRIRSADAQVDISDMEPRIPVNGKVTVEIGKPLRMEFSLANVPGMVSGRLHDRLDGREVSGGAEGATVEVARTKSVTSDEVFEHVDRMGQTPFSLNSLDIALDEGVGMGFSQIHRVRAAALEDLERAILEALGYGAERKGAHVANVKAKRAATAPIERPIAEDISICAYVSNPECARVAKRNGADRIYVGALNYRRGMAQMCGIAEGEAAQAGYPKHCIQVMGAISHDAVGQSREALLETHAWASVQEGSNVMVESLDGIDRALQLSCEMEIGPQLPVVNHASLDVASALGADRVWLSSELSLAQIEELSSVAASAAGEGHAAPEFGIMIAGAQELMTCEHCMLMSIGECDESCLTCSRRKVPLALRDRLGYEFPVVSDALGRSHIFNSLNTDNMNSIPRLIDANVRSFMVNAQLMDPGQTAQEIARLRSAIDAALSGNREIEKRKGTTTAHMHRPVA